MRTHHHRGFTIVEAAIVAVIATIIVAVAVPVLANVTTSSGEARSLSNLRILIAAHDSYSQTFSQRQLTFVIDNAGVYNGNCQAIVSSFCPPQLILGTDPNGGAIWGYFIGSGMCSGFPGSCASNWVAYKPMEFLGASAGFGSFRLGNAAAFNDFVEGRFYSDTFYSPNDALAYSMSAQYRDKVVDFASMGGDFAYTSYCMSPAAMWHPDVLSNANGGYKSPDTFADGYKSPSVTQCLHPDLKTRLLEHNWCDNPPGMTLPTSSTDTYPFNASSVNAPMTAFFDGHVVRLPNAKAIADDDALFKSSGQRLWSRTTPFGAGGYAAEQAFDAGPRTSHTILTIDGILGRDVLTTK